jgi:hypothetical protein
VIRKPILPYFRSLNNWETSMVPTIRAGYGE